MHKLERYLADHDLTQERFAEMIGSTQESVSRWISGQRMPRPSTMARIAAETKGAVTANDFVAAIPDEEERSAA